MIQTVFIETLSSDEELLELKKLAMGCSPFLGPNPNVDEDTNRKREANGQFLLTGFSLVPDIVDELIARRSPHNILNAIWQAIQNERRYQDKKWGTLQENPHTVPGWLLVMEEELAEAKRAWVRNVGDAAALQEILQVIAVGVACLEQYGVVEREQDEQSTTAVE